MVLLCSFLPREDVSGGAGGLIPTGQWTFPYFHQSYKEKKINCVMHDATLSLECREHILRNERKTKMHFKIYIYISHLCFLKFYCLLLEMINMMKMINNQ